MQDLTISDIEKLSEETGKPIADLITEIILKETKQHGKL